MACLFEESMPMFGGLSERTPEGPFWKSPETRAHLNIFVF